jgi:hypothetical protein
MRRGILWGMGIIDLISFGAQQSEMPGVFWATHEASIIDRNSCHIGTRSKASKTNVAMAEACDHTMDKRYQPFLF